MFVLVVVRDTLVIAASRVHSDPEKLEEAILWKLEAKYCNRVIPSSGLVIKLHDLLHIGNGKVYPSEGNTAVSVEFRLVVFRPFEGETLVGRVKSSSPDGIVVSLNFFDHVLIPRDGMKSPSKFVPEHSKWKWMFEDDNGEVHALWIDQGDKLRFKVMNVSFEQPQAIKPSNTEDYAAKKTPMTVFGTIEDTGLGPLGWWDQDTTTDVEPMQTT